MATKQKAGDAKIAVLKGKEGLQRFPSSFARGY